MAVILSLFHAQPHGIKYTVSLPLFQPLPALSLCCFGWFPCHILVIVLLYAPVEN